MCPKEKTELTKEYCLLINDELMEFLRETNWKVHRKGYGDGRFIVSNMMEEWIDIFKYWLSLGQLWGFTPEDLIQEYYRKSAVVEQRYEQETQLEFEAGKVAGVDIDGVLAQYPEGFLDFVNGKLGTNYTAEGLKEYNLYEAFDIPVPIMEQLKDEFRSTGRKRHLPVIPGAKEFLETLRAKGYQIVLLSARPYKQYKRIFADTQEWLKKNQLPYDAILWDENKCVKLLREFGQDTVSFFVEDHLGQANDVARLGCKVYLLEKSYNQGATRGGIIRVRDLEHLTEILKMEGEGE